MRALKAGEWRLGMRLQLTHTDFPLQETLQDGDAPESVESVDEMRGSQQALEAEAEGEGEGMEVQHLESSETESQSLDIEERAEGSSSSLSSERLEETSSTVSVTISESGGGAAERTEPSAEPYSQQATRAEASGGAQYVGESIELLQTTLRLRESSVDPQDSHHSSADSSNGSARQADLSSQSEDFEDGHGVVHLSSLSLSSESASRTSVVVERGHHPPGSSGEGASGGRQSQQQQQQQQQTQQQEEGDGTSRYSPTTGIGLCGQDLSEVSLNFSIRVGGGGGGGGDPGDDPLNLFWHTQLSLYQLSALAQYNFVLVTSIVLATKSCGSPSIGIAGGYNIILSSPTCRCEYIHRGLRALPFSGLQLI